jgi:hypothetical protein
MPRRILLLGLRSNPLTAIRLRATAERDDALRVADWIIGVPWAKLDHVTNMAAVFLSGAILHALYVGHRIRHVITLDDLACGLTTEAAPTMLLYEAMWNNRHGTPTAAGFIPNVPNAAISDTGHMMLNQRLNDILAAHGIIERRLARYLQ